MATTDNYKEIKFNSRWGKLHVRLEFYGINDTAYFLQVLDGPAPLKEERNTSLKNPKPDFEILAPNSENIDKTIQCTLNDVLFDVQAIESSACMTLYENENSLCEVCVVFTDDPLKTYYLSIVITK